MISRRAFGASLTLALAAIAAGARDAMAWVPPADFLVGRMAEKRKTIKTLQISGIRTFLGRNVEGGKQDVAETTWASGPAWRIERRTPRGEVIEVSDGKRRVTVNEGKAGAMEPDAPSLERMLLFGGNEKDELMRALDAAGVRRDVTALGRLDGRVAWIIGAKEGDTASPQLWIDKDRSFPLQLVDPRTKRTVRYDGWGDASNTSMVPARISWLKGADVEQELKIDTAKVNPKLGADLFKPEAPVLATPPPTPAPTAKPGATPKPAATAKPAATPTPKPR